MVHAKTIWTSQSLNTSHCSIQVVMMGSTVIASNSSTCTAVPTSEEKRFLKSEIKSYLDRAEEIALLSQVIWLTLWPLMWWNTLIVILYSLQKPTPKLTDQLYSTMSSTVNSSKWQYFYNEVLVLYCIFLVSSPHRMQDSITKTNVTICYFIIIIHDIKNKNNSCQMSTFTITKWNLPL